jgi:hypothetical protein
MLERFDNWHKTRVGYLVFAVVELVITYGLASLAIYSGSLWWYILFLIFLLGSLQNIWLLIRSFSRGKRQAS